MTTQTATIEAAGQADAERDRDTRGTAPFNSLVRAGHYPVVPESVRHALAASDRIFTLRMELSAPSTTPGQFVQQATDELLAGKDLADFVRRASDAWLSADRRTAASQALVWVENSIQAQAKKVVADALPALLGGLRPELEDSVKQLLSAYAVLGDVDLDNPDADVLLAMTKKTEKDAWGTVREQTQRYRRIRNCQRAALLASSISPIGRTPYSDRHTWEKVHDSGILDVSAPGTDGLPGRDLGKRGAVRAVVTRRDVWLPDVADATDAWHRTFGIPGQMVPHLKLSQQREQGGHLRPGSFITDGGQA